MTTQILNIETMSKQQLISEAVIMAQYQNDVDGLILLNEILGELKWKMSTVAFSEFKKSIIN